MRNTAGRLLLLVLLVACRSHRPVLEVRQVADEFLRAYNSGSIDSLTAFFERHAAPGKEAAAPERALWVFAHVWQPIRTFDVFSIAEQSERAITLLGQSAVTEAWYRFSFEVEADGGGITFGFENAEPPLPQTKISLQEGVDQLRAYAHRVCSEDVFSGAILVARNGRPLFSHACGASDETGSPNTLETAFNLGSATKMFTAVAVLQLVSQRKLALDDVVGRHLPGFAHPEVVARVTVEHLLTHRSGLGTFFTPEYRERKRQIGTVEGLVPFITSQPLAFVPGEQYGYSNAGYALLGLLIQAASGSDYYEFIDASIFTPAGMRRSGWPKASSSGAGRATGFTFMSESGSFLTKRAPNHFVHAMRGSPAGGSYSTVGDLLAFDRALRSHQLLPATAEEALWRPRSETERQTKYGYGFEIRESRAGRIAGHNGHHFGVSAQFDMYLDSGFTVVVLSNYDPPAAPVVAAKVMRVLEGVVAHGD